MGNVFNRYGAGGGKSEGLYLWKKYAGESAIETTNPIVTVVSRAQQLISGNYYTVYDITTNSFDMSKLPSLSADINDHTTWKNLSLSDNGKFLSNFFDGFTNTSTSYFKNEYNSLSYIYGYSAATVMGLTIVDSSHAWFGMMSGSGNPQINGNFTYNGTKTIKEARLDFVGYVVSDKEDAYPDKEVKDGYYYEKVDFDLGLLDCTKFETGSFTMTSDNYYRNVNHSMGIMPKFAIVWRSGATAETVNGVKYQAVTYTENGNGVSAFVTYSSIRSKYGGSASSTLVQFQSESGNSTYYYRTGDPYKYILFA